ncbi:MAG TPA: hypothetical protein PKA10_03235 [Selenomonadales bacterium]|nr:hypothetical protein [Selenomonadales bacterium]
MISFWFVCDGKVEEYSGQEADWDNSAVVLAKSPEEALIKLILYNGGTLERGGVLYNGKVIEAIY